MRPPILDPTAGATARAIRAHPEAPQPICDPTDRRYGELMRDTREDAADQQVGDPTDPEYRPSPA